MEDAYLDRTFDKFTFEKNTLMSYSLTIKIFSVD